MIARTRQTSALAAGSVVSAVLAYVFFALVTRALGAGAAAPVSVLWAYWGFAGAALTFPIQHWIARSVAAYGGERSVREALPSIALVVATLSVTSVAVAWLLRSPLFRDDGLWFPLLIGGATAGSAVLGVVRGTLTARRRFAALGMSLVAENAARCVLGAGLLLAGVRQPELYGLCLVLGYLAPLAWPSALRLGRTGNGVENGSPLVFLGGASGGQLIGQTMLTGGPVVLALAGGSPASITGLFAALALFRAPYTLSLGMLARVTGWFTRLVSEARVAELRRVQLRLVGATLAGALVAAVVGWTLGPWLLTTIFGADVELTRQQILLVAVGNAFAIGNLAATVLVLAHGRASGLATAWLVAMLPAGFWFALSGGSALDRTIVAFLLVEAVAFVLFMVEVARDAGRLEPARSRFERRQEHGGAEGQVDPA